MMVHHHHHGSSFLLQQFWLDRSLPHLDLCSTNAIVFALFISPTICCAPLRAQVFKHTTLFFSHTMPNLTQVIPAMDHVNKVLSTISTSAKFSEPIQVACGITKKALNHYYSYTDMSVTYCITMSKFHMFCVSPPANVLTFALLVLHPSHKLYYFKKMCWPEAWCTTVKELLIKKYRESYEGCYINEDSKDDEQDDDNLSNICSTNRSTGRSSGRSSQASFYDEDGAPSPSDNNNNNGTDEELLELNMSPFLPVLTCTLPDHIMYRIKTCLMPLPQLLAFMHLSWGMKLNTTSPCPSTPHLMHWHGGSRGAASTQTFLAWCWTILRSLVSYFYILSNLLLVAYPSLHWIATSVNVEHVFSHSWLLLSHTCSYMASQTTHALLYLRAWSKAGYVKMMDLQKTAQLPELDGDTSDIEMEDGWDTVDVAMIDA